MHVLPKHGRVARHGELALVFTIDFPESSLVRHSAGAQAPWVFSKGSVPVMLLRAGFFL